MANLKSSLSIKQWQTFCEEVYGLNNDRDFTTMDMLSNIQRFVMRSIKGIRKRDDTKIKINLLISLSWFMSLMNQLHIDLEETVWQRFPYLCSYCGTKPCSCASNKIKKRQKISINNKIKPISLKSYQEMFQAIYPRETRSLENAGIHLAEEMGELSEAVTTYRGNHSDTNFKDISLEAADFFSCCMGVTNSLKIDLNQEITIIFKDNCHVCHKLPCQCDFNCVMSYKS